MFIQRLDRWPGLHPPARQPAAPARAVLTGSAPLLAHQPPCASSPASALAGSRRTPERWLPVELPLPSEPRDSPGNRTPVHPQSPRAAGKRTCLQAWLSEPFHHQGRGPRAAVFTEVHRGSEAPGRSWRSSCPGSLQPRCTGRAAQPLTPRLTFDLDPALEIQLSTPLSPSHLHNLLSKTVKQTLDFIHPSSVARSKHQKGGKEGEGASKLGTMQPSSEGLREGPRKAASARRLQRWLWLQDSAAWTWEMGAVCAPHTEDSGPNCQRRVHCRTLLAACWRQCATLSYSGGQETWAKLRKRGAKEALRKQALWGNGSDPECRQWHPRETATRPQMDATHLCECE